MSGLAPKHGVLFHFLRKSNQKVGRGKGVSSGGLGYQMGLSGKGGLAVYERGYSSKLTLKGQKAKDYVLRKQQEAASAARNRADAKHAAEWDAAAAGTYDGNSRGEFTHHRSGNIVEDGARLDATPQERAARDAELRFRGYDVDEESGIAVLHSEGTYKPSKENSYVEAGYRAEVTKYVGKSIECKDGKKHPRNHDWLVQYAALRQQGMSKNEALHEADYILWDIYDGWD